MRFFPTRFYKIKLDSSSKFLNNLRYDTLIEKMYDQNKKKQVFIGMVTDDEFKISLSTKILNLFCEFYGRIEKETAIVKVKVHKYAKVFFATLSIFLLLSGLHLLVQSEFVLFMGVLVHIAIIRFVYIELGYGFCLKKGIKKLSERDNVLSIVKVPNVNPED